MTRNCAEHTSAFLRKGRLCLLKYAESGSLQAVRVGCVAERFLSGKEVTQASRIGRGWGLVGVGERVMRIRIRCFPFAIS